MIHGDLVAVAEGANAFLAASGPSGDRLPGDEERRAADHYGNASDRLLGRLMRHLADEEDLIIPLILDRGEASIGI